MRLLILAVGKLKKNTPEDTLIQNYIKNAVYPITVKEIDIHKNLPTEQQKKEESASLLKAVPPHTKIIVLDEKGAQMTSRDFAGTLSKWQDAGCEQVAFLIGGAYGHSTDLKDKADLLLSLGKMTMPHMLARVVLTEQLYRAGLIAQNHPYHKD